MSTRLAVGYVPLVDAAPLIVASQMGFDQEEGLDIELVPAPSWSTLRDLLAFGRVDAAHMLSPVPVAMALGVGGMSSAICALMVLSANGNVIGVSQALAKRMSDEGHDFAFNNAASAGSAMIRAADPSLRIGVPFPFSMHAELIYYWLAASGLPTLDGVEVKTVAPSQMADAIAVGDIDAFCVGEPWGSRAVERGLGSLLLPGYEIWSFAPEKVLAARSAWVEDNPELTGRLMRAVWKASRWLGKDGLQTTASELLSRPEYLDIAPEVIDRAFFGRLVITANGETRHCPRFLEFFQGATTFPWKSQAAWIADRIALRLGLDRAVARDAARAVFRSDLYRRNLGDLGAVLPKGSSKLEGANLEMMPVAADGGHLVLAENRFFDGQTFDPCPVN